MFSRTCTTTGRSCRIWSGALGRSGRSHLSARHFRLSCWTVNGKLEFPSGCCLYQTRKSSAAATVPRQYKISLLHGLSAPEAEPAYFSMLQLIVDWLMRFVGSQRSCCDQVRVALMLSGLWQLCVKVMLVREAGRKTQAHPHGWMEFSHCLCKRHVDAWTKLEISIDTAATERSGSHSTSRLMETYTCLP